MLENIDKNKKAQESSEFNENQANPEEKFKQEHHKKYNWFCDKFLVRTKQEAYKTAWDKAREIHTYIKKELYPREQELLKKK